MAGPKPARPCVRLSVFSRLCCPATVQAQSLSAFPVRAHEAPVAGVIKRWVLWPHCRVRLDWHRILVAGRRAPTHRPDTHVTV